MAIFNSFLYVYQAGTSKNAHLPTRGAQATQGTSIFSIPKGLADSIQSP